MGSSFESHNRPLSAPVTAHGRPESAGSGRRPGSAAGGRPGSAGSSGRPADSAKGRPGSAASCRPDSAQLRPLKEHEEEIPLGTGTESGNGYHEEGFEEDDEGIVEDDGVGSPLGSPMDDEELRIVEDDEEAQSSMTTALTPLQPLLQTSLGN